MIGTSIERWRIFIKLRCVIDLSCHFIIVAKFNLTIWGFRTHWLGTRSSRRDIRIHSTFRECPHNLPTVFAKDGWSSSVTAGPTIRFWGDPFLLPVPSVEIHIINQTSVFLSALAFPLRSSSFYFLISLSPTSQRLVISFWMNHACTFNTHNTYHILHTLYFNLNSSQLYSIQRHHHPSCRVVCKCYLFLCGSPLKVRKKIDGWYIN